MVRAVVVALLEDRTLVFDDLPVVVGQFLQDLVGVGASGEDGVFGLVGLVGDVEFFAGLDDLGEGVAAEAGHVGLELAVLDDAVGDLEARVDELGLVFRTFEDRLIVHLHKFVDVAEARVVLAGGNGVAHAETVDAGTLFLEV